VKHEKKKIETKSYNWISRKTAGELFKAKKTLEENFVLLVKS